MFTYKNNGPSKDEVRSTALEIARELASDMTFEHEVVYGIVFDERKGNYVPAILVEHFNEPMEGYLPFVRAGAILGKIGLMRRHKQTGEVLTYWEWKAKWAEKGEQGNFDRWAAEFLDTIAWRKI